MDEVNTKLLIVTKNEIYYSLLSIGDIQRAIIKNVGLNSPLQLILRNHSKLTVANSKMDESIIRKLVYESRAEFMPVINEDGDLVNVVFWEDHFSSAIPNKLGLSNIPVVIMAGGRGSRLKPITNIIPKAMLPIGDKPILENILDRFTSFGADEYYFMLNYKNDMIISYFDSIKKNVKVNYIIEKEPLGTAGSLSLLKGKINSTFFVTNCDIIVNTDYNEIYNYHRVNSCEITLVSALKHYAIPYGTIETTSEGYLRKIEEKPELTLLINSGMYLLEPHLLEEVPNNSFFHITSLIDKVMSRKGKVGVFPVSEKSWMDIGEWEEYNRTQKYYNDYFKHRV